MVLLGNRIRELRIKYNLTQAELANQVGVSKATITAYESDLRQPSCDVLIKLANTFKVSIDSLLLNRSEHVMDISGLEPKQILQVQNYIRYLKESELLELLFSKEELDVSKIENIRNKWNNDI